MTLRALFQIALAVIAGAMVLMTTAIVTIKARRQVGDRRREVLVAEVRPRVLAAIGDAQAIAQEFRGRRRSVAEALAVRLLPKLRGADRSSLTRALDGVGGAIARARVGLLSVSPTRRQSSAELLGAAGVEHSSERLIDLLRDRDAGVRMAAARSLGRIGTPDAVAPLLQALDDRRVPANTISMSVLRIGTAGAPGLVPALESGAARTRSVAAELVGSIGLAEAHGRLEVMLDDDDRTVRQSAVRALGRLGLPSSAPTLITRLEHELARGGTERDVELAVAMVAALGQIGHRAALPILHDALALTHRLSFAAASALARIDPRPMGQPGNEHTGATPTRVSEILVGRGGGPEPPLISWRLPARRAPARAEATFASVR